MTERFGDEGVTTLTETAKKVSTHKNNAMNKEEARMRQWLASGKPVREVFKLLGLKKAGDSLLTSPLFKSWSTYVKSFNMAYPDKKSSLVEVLTAKYGEHGVSKLVEAALKVKRSSIIAKSVQAEQFERWIANGMSLWDVFVLLKLSRAGDKLLENPLLNTFTKFTNAVNRQFQNDWKKGLVKMEKIPVAAKYAPGTSMIPTNSERALFQLWLVSEIKPERVFEMLKLNEADDNLLTSPLFATFLKFTDTYLANFPDSDINPCWIVRDYYFDVYLVRLILMQKKVSSPCDAVKRMEAGLLPAWMWSTRSPDKTFKWLELDKVLSPTELLQSPLFMYWIYHLGELMKIFPGKQIHRTILATNYKDEDFMDAIAAARKNPETKDVAEKLETELFEQYIMAEKDPADVANLLHVKHEMDNDWIIWKRYEEEYHKYHNSKQRGLNQV